MSDNIRAFFEKVQSSPELQQKLTVITQASEQQVAKEMASLSQIQELPFTSDEFLEFHRKQELSDEQLAGIGGGFLPIIAMGVVQAGLLGYVWATNPKEPGKRGAQLK